MARQKQSDKTNLRAPSKTFLVEDERTFTGNILKVGFSEEQFKLTLFTTQQINLPWYRRIWHALLYVFGIDLFLARNDRGVSIVVRENDYEKLLTIATMAYLRQVQKNKSADTKTLNKT